MKLPKTQSLVILLCLSVKIMFARNVNKINTFLFALFTALFSLMPLQASIDKILPSDNNSPPWICILQELAQTGSPAFLTNHVPI